MLCKFRISHREYLLFVPNKKSVSKEETYERKTLKTMTIRSLTHQFKGHRYKYRFVAVFFVIYTNFY